MQLFHCRVTTSIWFVSLFYPVLNSVHPVCDIQPVLTISDIFYSCANSFSSDCRLGGGDISTDIYLYVKELSHLFYIVFICFLVNSLGCWSVPQWLSNCIVFLVRTYYRMSSFQHAQSMLETTNSRRTVFKETTINVICCCLEAC